MGADTASRSVLPVAGDALMQHLTRVHLVEPLAPPPAAWSAVHSRFLAFGDLVGAVVTPARDRLVEGVVRGATDAELGDLFAAASAEAATGPHRGKLVEAVREAVLPALEAAYAPVAQGNWGRTAAHFNTLANKLTTAVQRCGDPEADAADLIERPDAARRGWTDSLVLAGQLSKLLPVIVASATLGGADIFDDTLLIPLVIDTGNAHRRKLWQAWGETGGRAGRWGRLAQLDGVTIRAIADLEDVEPYRVCKPLIRRYVAAGGPDSVGIRKAVVLDPESPGVSEADIDELVEAARRAG